MKTEVPRDIVQNWVLRLEAFKGRSHEDYAHLIEPLTEFVYKTGFGNVNVEELSKLAQALVVKETKITLTKAEPTITAKFLADQIKPWIEEIREKLFHSKSAPFRSVNDAEKWRDEVGKDMNKRIKILSAATAIPEYLDYRQALANQSKPPTEEDLKKLVELFDAAKKALKELGEPPEQTEDEKRNIGLIIRLLVATKEITEVTGFTWQAVKMFILADAPPVLPPFTLSIFKGTHPLPSGKSLLNHYAKVTIRGHITEKDLRSLYRGIRRELGIRRSKSLSEQNIRLCEMVEQRGGIPKEGVMAFWKSMIEEWNKRYRGKYRTYTTVQGIQIAYKRILARLERRMIQGGTK